MIERARTTVTESGSASLENMPVEVQTTCLKCQHCVFRVVRDSDQALTIEPRCAAISYLGGLTSKPTSFIRELHPSPETLTQKDYLHTCEAALGHFSQVTPKCSNFKPRAETDQSAPIVLSCNGRTLSVSPEEAERLTKEVSAIITATQNVVTLK